MSTVTDIPNEESKDIKNKCDNYSDYDDDDNNDEQIPGIKFVNYRDESQIQSVMRLVGKDLSEPYSIFTYRYFLHRFPQLCIFAVPTKNDTKSNDRDDDSNNNVEEPIGCVVCKLDPDNTSSNDDSDVQKNNTSDSNIATKLSGYMAMLAVDTSYRRSGIGTALVKRVLRRMRKMGCQSVTLETEVSNKAAMKLYEERLGFVREEFLARYYLNWGDAYRLKLYFPGDNVHQGEEDKLQT